MVSSTHCPTAQFLLFFLRVSGAAAPEGQMTYGSTQGDFRFSVSPFLHFFGSPFLRFSVSPVLQFYIPPPPLPPGEMENRHVES